MEENDLRDLENLFAHVNDPQMDRTNKVAHIVKTLKKATFDGQGLPFL